MAGTIREPPVHFFWLSRPPTAQPRRLGPNRIFSVNACCEMFLKWPSVQSLGLNLVFPFDEILSKA